MRDFELNRSVDALGVAATNSKSDEVTPQWLLVPVAAAAVYLAAVYQVGLGVAYWVGAGYRVSVGYQQYIY